MNTLIKTQSIMRKFNIVANKRFGQNFLIDDNVLFEICNVSDITDRDLVIEIGPGLGNLTEYIFQSAKYLLLVEIDPKMVEVIEDRFKNKDNFTLLNEDVLKVDIDKKVAEIEEQIGFKFEHVKVVANLPYYITTPIIFKLLENSDRIDSVTIMIQKEVAERMVAAPKSKDFGILTVMVEYFSNAEIAVVVPKNSFIPAPEVTSAVVTLQKDRKYQVKNEKLFFDLVKAAFAQRRKKMINSLVSSRFNSMSKEEIEGLFAKCGLDLNTRAEELEITDFVNIVNNID